MTTDQPFDHWSTIWPLERQRLDYAHELCEARREQLAEENMTRLVVCVVALVAVAVACTPSRPAPAPAIDSGSVSAEDRLVSID